MLLQVQAVLNLWSLEIFAIIVKQQYGATLNEDCLCAFPPSPTSKDVFHWGFFRTLSLCVENMFMEIVTGNV